MKKLWILGFLVFAVTLPASQVFCPIHPVASCYNTGSISSSGAHRFHCTCGDDTWVAAAVGEQTRQAIPAVPQTAITGQMLQGIQMANENKQPRQAKDSVNTRPSKPHKMSKKEKADLEEYCKSVTTGICAEKR